MNDASLNEATSNNFIVGYAPGLPGRVGKSGLRYRIPKRDKEPLKTWLTAVAQEYPPEKSGQYAGQNLALYYAQGQQWRHFLHSLIAKHKALIIHSADGRIVVYGSPQENVPAYFLKVLQDGGVTADMPALTVSDVVRPNQQSTPVKIGNYVPQLGAGAAPAAQAEPAATVPPPPKDAKDVAAVPTGGKWTNDQLADLLSKKKLSRMDISNLRQAWWTPQHGSLPADLDPELANRIVDILVANKNVR